MPLPGRPRRPPRLGVTVRAGNEELGSIWVVDAEDRLGSAAEQALSDVANIVSLHLLTARTAVDAVRHRRADLLQRLFADPSSVTAVAPQLGLDPNAPVAVAAFAVSADELEVAHAATRLTDLVSLHCEALYGRPACASIDGTVYALLPTAHRALVANITQRAHSALRLPVHAGIGSVVAGLHAVASSRAEADLVLRALTERPGDPCQVATIEEAWASATLSAMAQVLATQNAMPRGPEVQAHDREHGTTYAPTLLAYLDAHGDMAIASSRLSVHPNTIRYRLARAEEIFGFDLDNADERLVLWLRLRLSGHLG
ncbi:hypothetical protein GCM10029964_080080 [Kibdelosporangium lantanae]